MTASITGFDLLQEKGPTNKRTFSLTAIGRAIVIAKDEATRKAALQKAALSYDIIRVLYTLWPEGFPSDDAIRLELLERGFTERTAARFLTVFKETYLYADLGNAVILSEDMEETESKNNHKDEDVRAIKTKSLKLEGLEEYTLTLSRNKEVKLYASNTLTEGDIDFMLEWIKRLDLARKVNNYESRQETEEND
jgi:hypothetical protein